MLAAQYDVTRVVTGQNGGRAIRGYLDRADGGNRFGKRPCPCLLVRAIRVRSPLEARPPQKCQRDHGYGRQKDGQYPSRMGGGAEAEATAG